MFYHTWKTDVHSNFLKLQVCVKAKNMNTKLKFLDQKQNIGFRMRQGSENVKSWHSENASAVIVGTWNSALCSHFSAEGG